MSIQNKYERKRDSRLRRKYGITLEQQNSILIQQNNSCAICKKPFKKRNDIHVDHNHLTGELRGLLCGKCNWGLGMFDDDKTLFLCAIEYLSRIPIPKILLPPKTYIRPPKKARIKALISSFPHLSEAEIARKIKCNRSTVYRACHETFK